MMMVSGTEIGGLQIFVPQHVTAYYGAVSRLRIHNNHHHTHNIIWDCHSNLLAVLHVGRQAQVDITRLRYGSCMGLLRICSRNIGTEE